MLRSRTHGLFTLSVVGVASLALSIPATGATHSSGHGRPDKSAVSDTPLPLGAAGLQEQRTTQVLQPGVTLTTIVRGAADGTEFWTVEMVVPSGSTDPDPDAPAAALRDRASAEQLAADLVAEGFAARAESVTTPAMADYAGGLLGWRVRVGQFPTQAAADVVKAELAAAAHTGSSLFTGWDGDEADDSGPWVVQALTIDPKALRGKLDLTYGPDIEQRETTSALAQMQGAVAAVNAGYFVLDPNNGAPGDPAGIGVYDGMLLSETVNGRPALVIRDDARKTAVERLRFTGTVSARRTSLPLDGINRVPNKIRNCGGLGDQPTILPRHDFTCTDDSELVVFTPQFGASTSVGPGVEAVLNSHDRVVAVRNPRGGPLSTGQRSVQATGDLVDDLQALAAPGTKLKISLKLRDSSGRRVKANRHQSFVNGGPELVRRGQVYVTVSADGFVRSNDPSFYYGFSHKRNPRTFAGVDRQGRTLLVTSDGRDVDAFGLSLAETGAVAKTLGMVAGMNLDGGGSTTMVVDGQVINDPSDAAGERPVGDALLILPGNRRH